MLEFHVLRKISEGSAAEMFLAQEEKSEERVIVEVFRPELTEGNAATDRLLGEAKKRQKLRHPNVTRRVHVGKTPSGRLFMVTEPIGGEDLRSCLERKGALTLEDAIRVLVPVCDALEYMHQQKFAHGNVKPASIFLKDGLGAFKPKLVDYGLAYFRGGDDVALVPEGSVLVEAEYLSPERIKGQRASPASDIYALGLLIYEVLTGSPPYHGQDAEHTKLLHIHAEPPELPDYLSEVGRIYARCLAKDPEQRYPSASAVAHELSNLFWGSRAAVEPTPSDEFLRPTEIVLKSLNAPGLFPTAEKVGDTIGSYQLIRLLGEGAMGRVFLAQHTKLGRQVALKVMRPELSRDEDFVERFFREARAAHRINHEHIVQVFDFLEEISEGGRKRVYCVMELLQGQTLGQLIRGQSLSVRRAVHVARQVADALAAAHRVGVVHRDIKPDNVFITERSGERDYVKLLDFGVAKVNVGDDLKLHTTMDSAVVGTPAYMAPEQAKGLVTDRRTDVYALGTMLYELLAGELPFRMATFAQHLISLTTESPNPLPAVSKSGEPIPDGLRKVVMSCLAREQDHRPQSMGELSEKLRPYGDSHLAKPRRTREWFVTAASAVLGIALVGAAWMALMRVAERREMPAPLSPSAVMLKVQSTPPGARVIRLDSGEGLGVTPLAVYVPRAPKTVVLRLEREGHHPVERVLRLDQDAMTHVSLKPLDALPVVQPAAPVVHTPPARKKARPTAKSSQKWRGPRVVGKAR